LSAQSPAPAHPLPAGDESPDRQTVITAGAADGVQKVIGLAVGSAVMVAIVEWWTRA
jgi:hypothetical protein